MNRDEALDNIKSKAISNNILITDVNIAYFKIAYCVDLMLKNKKDIQSIKFIDPYAGSGMYLFIFLDILYNRLIGVLKLHKQRAIDIIKSIAENSCLIDIDINACEVCKYTLQIVQDYFNIDCNNIIINSSVWNTEYSNPKFKTEQYDICITNFPFGSSIKTSFSDIKNSLFVVHNYVNDNGIVGYIVPTSINRAATAQEVRERIAKLDDLMILNTKKAFYDQSVWSNVSVVCGKVSKNILNNTIFRVQQSDIENLSINDYVEYSPNDIETNIGIATGMTEEAENELLKKLDLIRKRRNFDFKLEQLPEIINTNDINNSIFDIDIFNDMKSQLLSLGSLAMTGRGGSGKTYLSRKLSEIITNRSSTEYLYDTTFYSLDITQININDIAGTSLWENDEFGNKLIQFLNNDIDGNKVLILNEVSKNIQNLIGPLWGLISSYGSFKNCWGKEFKLSDGTLVQIRPNTYIILNTSNGVGSIRFDGQVSGRFGPIVKLNTLSKYNRTNRDRLLQIISNEIDEDKSYTELINVIFSYTDFIHRHHGENNIQIREIIQICKLMINPFKESMIQSVIDNTPEISESDALIQELKRIAKHGREAIETIRQVKT